MPQPIDPQTETARLTAAERVQQIMDRASLAAQQRMAAQVESERVTIETAVQHTPETENEQVREEERRRNEERRHRKQNQAAEDDTPESARIIYNAEERPERLDAEERHKLDISI